MQLSAKASQSNPNNQNKFRTINGSSLKTNLVNRENVKELKIGSSGRFLRKQIIFSDEDSEPNSPKRLKPFVTELQEKKRKSQINNDSSLPKLYSLSNKLQSAETYQIHDLLSARVKQHRFRKKNESFQKVLEIDEAQEEKYTQSVEQIRDMNQNSKDCIVQLIANPVIRDSLNKSFEKMDKKDFYAQFKQLDMINQYSSRFQIKRKPNLLLLERFEEEQLTPRTCGLISSQEKVIKKSKSKTPSKPLKKKSVFSQRQSIAQQQNNFKQSLYYDNHLLGIFRINYTNLIGDTYTSVCSEALSSDELQNTTILSLINNRLTHKGIKAALGNITDKVEALDLSKNLIDFQGCLGIESVLSEQNLNLQHLSLEDSRINDAGGYNLLNALGKFSHLRRLNLSKNHIGDQSSQALGQLLIKNRTIQELYLHWNCIRSRGGSAIFQGLQRNDSMKVLDISFNSLEHWDVGGYEWQLSTFQNIIVICNTLQKSDSLIHLDISFNKFQVDDMKYFQGAIFTNYTLLGLHVEGNSCAYADVNGFVRFCEKEIQLESRINSKKLINGVDILGKNQLQKKNYNITDSCWICEGWYEIQFFFKIDSPKNEFVWIHLDFQNFEPYLMDKDESGLFFSIKRMCPPLRNIYFFYSNQSTYSYFIAYDSANIPMDKYLQSKGITQIAFKDQENKLTTVQGLNQINQVFSSQQQSIEKLQYMVLIDTSPRIKSRRYIDQKQQQRNDKALTMIRTWNVVNSNFSGFNCDTEELYDRCFEMDWTMGRISKWIKLEEEIPIIKRLFRQNYIKIKEMYKIYSMQAPFNNQPGISLSTCIEMVTTLNLVDSLSISRFDLDIIFQAVNTKSIQYTYKYEKHIVRFQLLEYLFKLAEYKFIRGQRQYFDAMSRFFDEMQYKVMDIEPSQVWRDKKFWNQNCDFVLTFRALNIKVIFQYFQGLNVNSNLGSTYLYLKALKEGLIKFKLCSGKENLLKPNSNFYYTVLNEKQINVLFTQSLMTQIDELTQDRHMKTTQLEFQEVLARLADSLSPSTLLEGEIPTVQQRIKLPLQVKFENLVQYLIEQINFEYQKKLKEQTDMNPDHLQDKSSVNEDSDLDLEAHRARISILKAEQIRRVGIQL